MTCASFSIQTEQDCETVRTDRAWLPSATPDGRGPARAELGFSAAATGVQKQDRPSFSRRSNVEIRELVVKLAPRFVDGLRIEYNSRESPTHGFMTELPL